MYTFVSWENMSIVHLQYALAFSGCGMVLAVYRDAKNFSTNIMFWTAAITQELLNFLLTDLCSVLFCFAIAQ